jgi:hypothetical protein
VENAESLKGECMDDLLPRLSRVILLMTKQLDNLTQKDLMTLLKAPEMTGFFKILAKIENDYDIDTNDRFFLPNIEKMLNWQKNLPGGKINVRKDFIKAYKRMDKFDKEEVKRKVTLHQTQRMANTLKEFFRLLDVSIDANKILPIEAFAQHLGMTFDELAENLDRVNWDDTDVEVEEPAADPTGKLTTPIHIEKQFFTYYHQQDKTMKIDIQQRITQGIPRKIRAELESLFAWLDMSTKANDKITFEDIVNQSNLHPQELIRYLDRVNWSADS